MAGKTPEIIEMDAKHLDEFMLRAKDSLANEDYELLDKIVLSYSGLVGKRPTERLLTRCVS